MGLFKNHSRARAIAHCGGEFPRVGDRPRAELAAGVTRPNPRIDRTDF